MNPTIVCLLLVAPALALAGLAMDGMVPELFARDELTELYERDSEKMPGPLSYGPKYMSGIESSNITTAVLSRGSYGLSRYFLRRS